MSMDDIHYLTYITQGTDNDHRKEELYLLSSDSDERVAYNALWTFTHFDLFNNEWLYFKHDDLIDRCLTTANNSHRRLLLTLLFRQPFRKDAIRTDFIDFCLSKIISQVEPYATRALCMKLAWEQCKYFPELIGELKLHLDMLASEPISPGLKTARKNILKKISQA